MPMMTSDLRVEKYLCKNMGISRVRLVSFDDAGVDGSKFWICSGRLSLNDSRVCNREVEKVEEATIADSLLRQQDGWGDEVR